MRLIDYLIVLQQEIKLIHNVISMRSQSHVTRDKNSFKMPKE